MPFHGHNSSDARISSMSPLGRTAGRALASSTALPAWSASYPKSGTPTVGADPAITGFWYAVKKNPSTGMAFHFANAHASGASDKHSKWRFLGLRERSVPTDGGGRLTLLEPVPLVEIGVFGGDVDVESNDEIRPKAGTFATASHFRWADRLAIAVGEQYVADDAIQLIQVSGMRAEMQINTQGLAYIIAIPACIASVSPGADAAQATTAVGCDL